MNLKTAKVTKHNPLTYDTFELFLETEEPFKFEAGEFITIKINDGQKNPCFRAYSIASSPNNKTLEFIIKVIPNGRGSNWLNSLRPGDKVEFIGPSGNFTFKTPPQKTALLIATGTGVTPFRSIIEDELSKGNKQPFHLIWGLRHIKDIFYKDLFEEIASKHENLTFDLTLSQPETEDWQNHKGRVTALLENLEIDTNNTEAYICGLNAMIESVTEILKDKGLSEEVMHFEKYD